MILCATNERFNSKKLEILFSGYCRNGGQKTKFLELSLEIIKKILHDRIFHQL